MIAINLDQVTVTYIAHPIFKELSWEIHSDRCVGLIGPNGCGKSTLLRLIAGELTSDTGFVVRASGLKLGYLTQEPRLTLENSVLQEALTASTELAQIEQALAAVEHHLADPAVYGDDTALAQVLEQQTRLLEKYTQLGGPSYDKRVRAVLQSVGFITEADLQLPVATLSGGQKKLLGLAKLLITQPDVLLLDEPDNHLDLAGKALLEQLINAHQGATIIVSHDRYLLDLVVDEIVELEDGRLTHYPGDYSEYVFEKHMSQLRQQQLFQAQQKEITRLEEAATRLLTWGRLYDNNKFIRRGKNILKRLDRLDRIEQPRLERRRMELALGGWRGSNKVLEITDLDKIFPATGADEENIVLAGLNLLIWHGERVGLVGPNGAGKSVLFRLILGQDTPSGGKIATGPSVEIGYYAQEHETLDYKRSLIDTVRQAEKLSESQTVSFLGKFLFNYEKARGPVSDLSGGERSRLQMALLMLTKANFLLLDEPTNNLDIASAEVLEDALADFEGTVFVISHDRYFLDRVVDRIVELVDGELVEYVGGYSDYLEAKSKRKANPTLTLPRGRESSRGKP
ncbi:MAG: ABC-F family ATP-binding cassette domain-containing protein [Caldilineaceae bacterium]